VDGESLDGLLDVHDLEGGPRGEDKPRVGLLAAGLGVKRGLGRTTSTVSPVPARSTSSPPLRMALSSLAVCNSAYPCELRLGLGFELLVDLDVRVAALL